MLQFNLSPLIGARPGERFAIFMDEGPLHLDDIDVPFIHGEMQFTRVQDGILVEAELQTEVTTDCTRCLAPFPCPLTLEVEEIIGLVEHSGSSFTYFIDEEGWFDPLPLLREQVWVSLPMKALCRPDCQGFCPECGADLRTEPCRCRETTIDPRLAVLAEFTVKGQQD